MPLSIHAIISDDYNYHYMYQLWICEPSMTKELFQLVIFHLQICYYLMYLPHVCFLYFLQVYIIYSMTETRAPFQYLITHLIITSHEVLKPRDWCLHHLVTLKFDRHLGSPAAEVPVKFQSDQTNLNTNLAASRLCQILSNFEIGPRAPIQYKDVLPVQEIPLWK